MRHQLKAQALRYGAVGLLGAAGYFTVVTGLVEGIGTDPVLAAAIGFTVVLAYSFVLNHRWTFKGHSESTKGSAIRYLVVSSIGFCLSAGAMFICVDVLEVSHFYGQLTATVTVPAVNFALNRVWTWRVAPG